MANCCGIPGRAARNGCGSSSACRRGWAARPCTASRRGRITGRNGRGFRFRLERNLLPEGKIRTSHAPCGCSILRAGSPKGSSRCSPVRNASTRAGGTAAKRGATTSSPARGNARSPGSTGSGAGRRAKAGSCMDTLPEYAELHCLSNFSFLRGASHAEELVERAVELGYAALAITDECSLAGIVRAHVAAKKRIKLIVGSEVQLEDGPKLILLAPDRAAYGALSSLITAGRRRAP